MLGQNPTSSERVRNNQLTFFFCPEIHQVTISSDVPNQKDLKTPSPSSLFPVCLYPSPYLLCASYD